MFVCFPVVLLSNVIINKQTYARKIIPHRLMSLFEHRIGYDSTAVEVFTYCLRRYLRSDDHDVTRK